MDSLGDIGRHLDRISERAHGIPNRIRSAIGLHDARDRRLGAIVFVVDVIEHFLASIVLDVDVDVGRLSLAIDADLRQKTLE